jgi:hypothetical protein
VDFNCGISAVSSSQPSPHALARRWRALDAQTPLYVLERLLRGTDAWEALAELTRGEPGGANNLEGNNQYTEKEVNCDNVTVDLSPDPAPPPPTGNSVSYALRCLKKKRPDLYERVKDGELSSHAWSNHEIARLCGVSEGTVRNVKISLRKLRSDSHLGCH